jgi:hypothetical protein
MHTSTHGTEVHRTQGERLVARVRELVREGNVRRIIIKNEEGRTLIELPLTIGVVGALLLPAWAALGAIAALVTDCSIEVEREEDLPRQHLGGHTRPPSRVDTPEEYRHVDEQC